MQTHLLSILHRVFRRKKRSGERRGGKARISKGSMSSIDSIGDRFVFNGCFRMTRGYPNWESATAPPPLSLRRRCSVSAGLYCYSRFSARSLERARERSEKDGECPPKKTSARVALRLRVLPMSVRALRIFSRVYLLYNSHHVEQFYKVTLHYIYIYLCYKLPK